MIEELIKNTKLLKESYNTTTNLRLKIDILIQIDSNIKILKENLSKEDFEKKLGILNRSISKKLEAIHNSELIEKFTKKLEELIKKIE